MITYSTSSSRDVDAVERRADRDRAELGRLVVGEPAAELAERRADGRDDHGTGHCPNVSPRQGMTAPPVALRCTRWRPLPAPGPGPGAASGAEAWAEPRPQPFTARDLRTGSFFVPLMSSPTVIPTDLITPLGAYIRLRSEGEAAFLLESVEQGRLGRHSFVGCGARVVSLEEAERLDAPVVGYLAYDHVARLEPTVPLPPDGPVPPESRFVVADTLVRFDHAARAGRGRSAATPTSCACCSTRRRRRSPAGRGNAGPTRRHPDRPDYERSVVEGEGAHPRGRRLPDRPLPARRAPDLGERARPLPRRSAASTRRRISSCSSSATSP